jgi:hypothetical protein
MEAPDPTTDPGACLCYLLTTDCPTMTSRAEPRVA